MEEEPLPAWYGTIVGKMRIGRVPPVKRRELSELTEEATHPRIIAATHAVSAHLLREGVRHAIIGAVAVGVHGWPRATMDVDVLVEDEAWFVRADGSTEPRVSMPETFGGVGIDYLPVAVGGDFLALAFERAYISEGVPIAPPEVVVCSKLLRHAFRDRADIVELIKAAVIDLDEVRAYLAEHTPMLVRRWEVLLEEAKREKAGGY